jgi:hypothetical protein
MSEQDRRTLLASQHAALWGESAKLYGADAALNDLRSPPANGFRNTSPYDHFATGSVLGTPVEPIGPRDPKENTHSRSREGSTSSPGSANPNNAFLPFDSTTTQASRTTASSPGNADSLVAGGRPMNAKQAPTSAGPQPSVAPIGTRPLVGNAQQSTSPASAVLPGQGSLQKPRTTTPLPSPLSFGVNTEGQGQGEKASGSPSADELAKSSGSAGSQGNARGGSGAWGNGGSVWGGKGGLGATKVW